MPRPDPLRRRHPAGDCHLGGRRTGAASAGRRSGIRRRRAGWRPGRAGRSGLRLVGGSQHAGVERFAPGGRPAPPRIENYLGFPTGLTGSDLARRATLQARKFGAVISSVHEAARIGSPDRKGSARSSSPTASASGAEPWSWPRAPTIAGCRPRMPSDSRASACTTRRPISRPSSARPRTSSSWAARTPPVRRSSSSPPPRARSMWSPGGRWRRRCPATWSIRSRTSRTSRSGRGARCEPSRATGSCEEVVISGAGPDQRVETQRVFAMIGASPRSEGLVDFVGQDDKGFVVTGEEAAPAARLLSALERLGPGTPVARMHASWRVRDRRRASRLDEARGGGRWRRRAGRPLHPRRGRPGPSPGGSRLGADRVQIRPQLLELVADPSRLFEAEIVGGGEHLLFELDHEPLELLRRLGGGLLASATPPAGRL